VIEVVAMAVVEVDVVAVEEGKVVVSGELPVAVAMDQTGGKWRPLISVNSSRCSRQEMSTMVYLSRNEVHWQQTTGELRLLLLLLQVIQKRINCCGDS
jgi:hypothetical protein